MVSAASSGTVLRIMPVGDSITAGYTNATEWTVPFTFGYRGPLYTKLTDAGYDFQFVGTSGEPWNYPFGADFGVPTTIEGPDLRGVGQDNHRGYGGATTSEILDGGVVGGSTNSFPGIVGMLNADDPDIVLLMIGTNGIGDALGNIDPLVNAIVTTKPNSQLIVAQIPPRATGGTGPTDPTVQYNSYIRNTVVPKYRALGKNVTTVDQFANLLTPGGAIDTSLICPDGAHLRPAANELLAQTWFEGIEAAMSVPEPRLVVSGTYTVGNTAPALPANNLIVQGSDTFSSSYSGGGVPAVWSPTLPDAMNDGVMTDANLLPILGWDNVTENFGWAVYQLDTTTNTLGYDVSSILSYAGWMGARVNQAVEIKYALVGDTIIAGNELGRTLGTFRYSPSNNSTPYAYSTMSITGNAGPVLSGISAIEVKYIDNLFDGNSGAVGAPGNFTAYKQFAVSGSPTFMLGDANRDGVVDDADASILAAHWQTTSGATWGMGDFNVDGAVNDKDAAMLAAHWTAGAGEHSVPEPSTLAGLLGLCLAGLLASARRGDTRWA
jgi:lysophospholipase L1-like esterase